MLRLFQTLNVGLEALVDSMLGLMATRPERWEEEEEEPTVCMCVDMCMYVCTVYHDIFACIIF